MAQLLQDWVVAQPSIDVKCGSSGCGSCVPWIMAVNMIHSCHSWLGITRRIAEFDLLLVRRSVVQVRQVPLFHSSQANDRKNSGWGSRNSKRTRRHCNVTRVWCQNRGMNLYQLVHCTHLDLKNKCTASRQFCLKDAQITDGSKWHPVVYGWDFLLFQGFWGWSVVVICPDGLHTYSLGWNYFVLDSRWVSCMKPILGQKKCRNIWLYLGTHRIHVCVFFYLNLPFSLFQT